MLARRMSTDRIPASRGIASLTDIPEGECRHGPPELVIRCKHSVIPVPVLARRRDEIGEPVQKLKRKEVDDAIGPRSRGLAAATGLVNPPSKTLAILRAHPQVRLPRPPDV